MLPSIAIDIYNLRNISGVNYLRRTDEFRPFRLALELPMFVIPFLYQFFVQSAAVLTALVVWDRCSKNREQTEAASSRWHHC